MPHGRLTVVVEGVTDIKTPGVNGRGSSYCTLACGSQVYSSQTVEGGGSHPHFKTAFEFEIDRTTNELDVCVYSKGSTSRNDDLVGYCKLNFKEVFFRGHTVPLTAFPIQQPSGNLGGKIHLSLKFKMRPSPNVHNAHAPMRCSSPPRVTRKIVGRQSFSLDWGYDCHEEGAPEAKSYRRTESDPPRHHEDYLNLPGTAFDNYQETKPQRHHVHYRNLPGAASDNDQEPNPSFIRYGNPGKLRPQGSITTYHARPSPITEYNQPIPGRPRYNLHNPGKPQYNQPIPKLLVHLGGEAVNGLAEGIGSEVANQFVDGVGQDLMNGGGQAVLSTLFDV